MIDFTQLNLGFGDAENYKRRENKDFFSQIFLKSNVLDELIQEHIYFLIGEKGTGKTAFSVFLSNYFYRDTSALISYIRETEYQQFIQLKKRDHLQLSDYTLIWKVIIYLLMSEKLSRDNNEKSIFSFARFRNLKDAIDYYYDMAFSPEIIEAMNFVDNAEISAKILSEFAELGGNSNVQRTFNQSRFQTNLIYILREFEHALRSIKLKHNHIIFIDGIDIRPSSIDYDDYLECVKGLANAVWSINNDFFAGIKDSRGRMKVVLLVRPDIFDSIGLQNQNAKVRDNSILLDWRTTYKEYRTSMIFELVDKLFSAQNKGNYLVGDVWDHYFPYKIPSSSRNHDYDDAFVGFLRFSLYRPRDIIIMLALLQESIYEKRRTSKFVLLEDFNDPRFKRKYAQYLLGEVKDQISFYYSAKDYEVFLRFFQYLNGKTRFVYDEYIEAYRNITSFLNKNDEHLPDFLRTPDGFLQFLYDLNVICYVEDPEDTQHRAFISWCFRDRSPSNISPKVKVGVRYEIHYGMTRSLRVGKRHRSYRD